MRTVYADLRDSPHPGPPKAMRPSTQHYWFPLRGELYVCCRSDVLEYDRDGFERLSWKEIHHLLCTCSVLDGGRTMAGLSRFLGHRPQPLGARRHDYAALDALFRRFSRGCPTHLLYRKKKRRGIPLDKPSVPLRDLVEEDDPDTTSLSWIELTLVASSGHPYPDTTISVTLPNGRTFDATTDGRGQWRADDVPKLGSCQIRLTKRPSKADRGQTIQLQGDEPRLARQGSLSLRSGRAHRLVVLRPCASLSY